MGKGGGDVTIGYKHYVGMHMVLCLMSLDKLTRITVDDRTAWEGEETGGQITVDAEDLFGGEGREGGVSGLIDVEMGRLTQTKNDYLLSKIGSNIPAFRGVSALVLRQCYLGNNPYLKPLRARGQRIYIAQDETSQWYPEKAGIPNIGGINTSTSIATSYVNLDGSSDGGNTAAEITANGVRVTASSPANRLVITMNHSGPYVAWTVVGSSYSNTVAVVRDGGSSYTEHGVGSYSYGSALAARNAWESAFPDGISLTGALTYDFGIRDTVLGDNTQGLSLQIDEYPAGEYLDMNPVHIIRECLTNEEWGNGYPSSEIDDDTFIAAADTIFDEGLGMSLFWSRQSTLDAFITEVKRHIDAAVFVSRFTGKWTIKLIRADYDPDSLITLDQTNVESVTNVRKPAFGKMINSVSVQFWNSTTGKDDSITLQDPASVQSQGITINTTVKYPGFTNTNNAGKAAARDLHSLSNPFLSCTIVAGDAARGLQPGDAFKFAWPKYRIGETIMRVVEMSFDNGTSNQVRIVATQDVFATPTANTVVVGGPGTGPGSDPDDVGGGGSTGGGWVDPSQPPSPLLANQQLAIELPYYEVARFRGQTDFDTALSANPDLGYVGIAAARATNAINARMWVDAGAGYTSRDVFDFAQTGNLVAAISKTDESAVLEDMSDIDLVVPGGFAQIDDELVRVDSVDPNTGAFTFGRGVLDTVPVDHEAGALVMFWHNYVGADTTEYDAGETLDIKITPISGAGQVALTDAIAAEITLDGRAFRPYPPGNLQIGGESYQNNAYGPDVNITWAHRDRKQQTSGTLADHFDGDIGPEVGSEYRFRAYVGTTLFETQSGITDNFLDWTPGFTGTVTIRLDTLRDGVYSRQYAEHTFEVFGTSLRSTEAEETRVTEEGYYRVTED